MKLKDLGLIALSGVLLLSGCNNSDDKKKDKNDGKETEILSIWGETKQEDENGAEAKI